MMIGNNKWKCLISSAIILIPAIIGILYWDVLPQKIATHWGIDGTENGYSSRAFWVFGFPVFMLAVHWFCIFATAAYSKNQTRKVITMLLWIVPVVSLFAGGTVYANAFGIGLDVGRLAMVFVGIMFAAVGNYFPKIRRNKAVGIRVKWALENDENWNATHRFGGKVWMTGGLILMFCAFLPETMLGITLPTIMVMLIVMPIVYSYEYYKKHHQD